MDFLNYCLKRESTGTVGAAAVGQWPDNQTNGEEFYRKFGNKTRPTRVAWDGCRTEEFKNKKKNAAQKYGFISPTTSK
jgi:hypothetical protein